MVGNDLDLVLRAPEGTLFDQAGPAKKGVRHGSKPDRL